MNLVDKTGGLATPFDRPRGRAGEGGAAMSGRMGAEQFEVEIENSMLAEAAEEISMHFAESAESRHVAERKKELARPRSLMNPDAIESYIEDTEEEEGGSEKLLMLVKRVMSGQGDPGMHARGLFTRPTAQYLALQYALQEGEKQGASGQTLENLHQGLEDLEMEFGPRIRAELNTIEVAKEGAPGPAGVVQFQAAYVDLVLGHATLAGALKLVLDQFGESGLEAGLSRLQRALGQDLAAARPSTEPAHLQNLVQDLYHLSVATTVLDGCHELLAQQKARFGLAEQGQAIALMKDLVSLSSESWVSSDRFVRLAEKVGAQDVEPQINFLTGVKGLLRQIPPKVFADLDQRQSVFNAAQDALDAAIDREDE
ncbi:type III secretion system gatekeeper subunit SctW [Ottowia thiooxydans]|uniref:Type III secretion protein W n=1 Tax=Ottowia thiooxydans TaxID=219182 RepID=A0ABV2QGB9_9BURK